MIVKFVAFIIVLFFSMYSPNSILVPHVYLKCFINKAELDCIGRLLLYLYTVHPV